MYQKHFIQTNYGYDLPDKLRAVLLLKINNADTGGSFGDSVHLVLFCQFNIITITLNPQIFVNRGLYLPQAFLAIHCHLYLIFFLEPQSEYENKRR